MKEQRAKSYKSASRNPVLLSGNFKFSLVAQNKACGAEGSRHEWRSSRVVAGYGSVSRCTRTSSSPTQRGKRVVVFTRLETLLYLLFMTY